jgi:hypothetical protein
VLAWHGVLVQKAKAIFPDICTQARQIFGIVNAEIGKSNQDIDPEIRTRVGLDSENESESEEEDEDKPNDGDAGDESVNNGEDHEDDQNSDANNNGNNSGLNNYSDLEASDENNQ